MARIVPMDYQTIQQNRRGFVPTSSPDVGKVAQDIGNVVGVAEHFVNPLVGLIARGMYNPQDTISAYQAAYPDQADQFVKSALIGNSTPSGSTGSQTDMLTHRRILETLMRQPGGSAEPQAPQMTTSDSRANVPVYVPGTNPEQNAKAYVDAVQNAPTHLPNEPFVMRAPVNAASVARSLANPNMSALDQDVTALRHNPIQLGTPEGLTSPGSVNVHPDAVQRIAAMQSPAFMQQPNVSQFDIPEVSRNTMPRIDLNTPAGLQFQSNESPIYVEDIGHPGGYAGKLFEKRMNDPRYALKPHPNGYPSEQPVAAHKPAEVAAMTNAGMNPATEQQVFRPAAPAQKPMPMPPGYVPTTFNEAKAMIIEGVRNGDNDAVQRAMRAFQVGNGLDVVPETWQEAITGAHKRRAFNELVQLAMPHGKTESELDQQLKLARVWNSIERANELAANNPYQTTNAEAESKKKAAAATTAGAVAANAPELQSAKAKAATSKGMSAAAEAAHAEEFRAGQAKTATAEAANRDAKLKNDMAMKKAQQLLTQAKTATETTGQTAAGRNAKIRAQASATSASAAMSRAQSYKRFVDKYQPYTGTERATSLWRTEQQRLEAELRKHKAEKAGYEQVDRGEINEETASNLGYRSLADLQKNLAEAKLKAKGELAKANQGILDTQAALDAHKEAGDDLGIVSTSKPAAKPALPPEPRQSDEPMLP